MKYIINFDYNKIKEINKIGMEDFDKKAMERKERVDMAKDLEIKKKIKSEKIEKLVLDTDDLLILRFIYTVGNEPKTIKDKNDKSYFWIKLNALLDEYEGLLFLTKTALNARLNKYVAMGLVERKCVKNEDGSFSFCKLTGVNELIYGEATKSDRVVKKAKDSNGNIPIQGQIHVEEAIEVKEASEVERVASVTGCTIDKAQEVLNYAYDNNKTNPTGFSIRAIKEGWELKKNNVPVVNNRNHETDILEQMLLGQVDYNQADIEGVLSDTREHNYISNNSKRYTR